MDDTRELFMVDDPHCGRPGCSCPHILCDRGFTYVHPRQVTSLADGHPDSYERVIPCRACKRDSHDAVRWATDRRDMGRRLRRVGQADDPGGQQRWT